MKTVRELIDTAAAGSGDRTFMLTPDAAETLSFTALRERAHDIARSLIALRPHGNKVALAVGRGRPTIELILGALYGGVVPVPLNPTTAAGQLGHVLNHCGAGIVIASRENAELVRSAATLSRWPGQVIRVEDLDPLDRAGAEESVKPPREDDQAILVYTSGTTARPKGVAHTHRGRVVGAEAVAARLGLGAEDRMLCVLPFYHLNAINAAIVALASGASIVVCPQFEPDSFWSQAARTGCSWSSLVPTMLAQLLTRAPQSVPPRADRMRFVRSSSAPLARDVQQRFEETFGIPVLQGMGMTEAGATIFQNPAPPDRNKVGSLGTPCGFEVRVLDEEGRPLEHGETGEIAIRGPTMMKGYHRDSEATRAILDHEGWLRTGERGYCDQDGYYYSVGRFREIIIKGGTNIAPREIEEALAAHPDVLEAACLGVPDLHLGEEIVAFAVLRAGRGRRPPSEAELLDACEARVGAFKTPSAIHYVDALPKGTSGELQRMRLRDSFPHLFDTQSSTAPSTTQSIAEARFVAPRTALEHWLARNWAAFLEEEAVGIRDDFFELGGYSLLAVRLFARLRQELGIQVPLGLCFDRPTIEGQALGILDVVQRRCSPEERVDVGAIPLAERKALEERLLEKLRVEGPPDIALPRSRVAAVLLGPADEASAAPPLFCAYGPSQYRPLALRLASRRKVYGLFGQREVDLLSTPAAGSSDLPLMEEFAALYCEAVRETQPRGPYYLAGFSFGGRVALEMARNLREVGEEVALLVIFDTHMPGSQHWNALSWGGDALRAIPRRLRRLTSRRSSGLLATTPSQQPESEIARDVKLASDHEVEIRDAARGRYVPEPYDGPVLLIRAQEPRRLAPGYRADPTLGWERIATGALSVREAPGRHLTILREPNVALVSQIVAEHLDASD